MVILQKIAMFSIVLLILVIAVSGCNSTTDPTNKTSSTPGVFENQWVKFNYPTTLTAVDKSTSDMIDILLYEGSFDNTKVPLGKINTVSQVRLYEAQNVVPSYVETIIAGKKAIRGKSSTSTGAYLVLSNNVGMWIDFEPTAQATADHVMNSLVIKKVPN